MAFNVYNAPPVAVLYQNGQQNIARITVEDNNPDLHVYDELDFRDHRPRPEIPTSQPKVTRNHRCQWLFLVFILTLAAFSLVLAVFTIGTCIP